MAKQFAVDVGDGGEAENTVTLVQGDKYVFGNTSSASDDFDAIMSTNSTADDMAELFKAALTGDVEGVELTSINCSGYTLEITNDGGKTDTLHVEVDDWDIVDTTWHGGNVGDSRSDFNVIDASGNGKANKIMGTSKGGVKTDEEGNKIGGSIKDLVGGSAKGEKDFKALLEAALDETDERVTLLDLGDDSFTIQVHRGDATDTFLFKNAGDLIDSVFDGLINLQNTGDQFIFAQAGDRLLGTGTDKGPSGSEIKDVIGNRLFLDELADLVAAVENGDIPNASVDPFGTTSLDALSLPGSGGSTDTVVFDPGLIV